MKEKEIFGEHEVDAIIRHFGGSGPATYLKSTQRSLTAHLLFDIHHKYQSRPDSVILVGWLQAGLVQPQFDRAAPPGADLTMVNWELPVQVTS